MVINEFTIIIIIHASVIDKLIYNYIACIVLNYILISKYGIIIVALHGLLLTQQDVQSCMQVYWITGDTSS